MDKHRFFPYNSFKIEKYMQGGTSSMKKHWFCFLLTATLLTGMTIGIGAASETANAVPKEVFAAVHKGGARQAV